MTTTTRTNDNDDMTHTGRSASSQQRGPITSSCRFWDCYVFAENKAVAKEEMGGCASRSRPGKGAWIPHGKSGRESILRGQLGKTGICKNGNSANFVKDSIGEEF